MSILDQRNEIVRLHERSGIAKKEALSLKREADEKLEALRDKIRGGESTGCRIKDAVILFHEIDNGKAVRAEKVYRDIEARLAKHKGELVLLIKRREESTIHGGPGYTPRDCEHFTSEEIQLGIISSSEISYGNMRCGIKTSGKKIISHDRFHTKKSQRLISDNLRFLGYSLVDDLDRPLKLLNPRGIPLSLKSKPQVVLALELKIGDTEVQEWFEKQGADTHQFFHQVARLLGKELGYHPNLSD